MKKYIKPTAKVVEIRLMGSCLDDYNVNNASYVTTDGNSASRRNNSFDWEEEETEDSMWK